MSTKKNVSCEPLTNHNHWSHSHLRKQHRQWLERLPAVSTVISTPQYKVINGFGYLKEPSPTDRDFTISIVFNPLSMLRKYDPQQAKSLLTNPSHTWLPDFGFSENFKHLLYTSIQFAIFIKRTANAERARVRKRRVKKLSNLSQKGSEWKHRGPGSRKRHTMAGGDRFSTGNDLTNEPHLWFEASCFFDFGGFHVSPHTGAPPPWYRSLWRKIPCFVSNSGSQHR